MNKVIKENTETFSNTYDSFTEYIDGITQNIWQKRAIWDIYDVYDENIIMHVGAQRHKGMDVVIHGTLKTLHAFPDREMKTEAIVWDVDEPRVEYFSSHRICSTATNLGPTPYGKATGKKIVFRTIADCAVKNGKIYEEWLVRDNLSIIEQLGFDIVEMAKKNNPYAEQKRKDNIFIPQLMPLKDLKKTTSPNANLVEILKDIVITGWIHGDLKKIQSYYHPNVKIHSIRNSIFSYDENAHFLQSVFSSFSEMNIDIKKVTLSHSENSSEMALQWVMKGKHSENVFFKNAKGTVIIMPGISHFQFQDNKIIHQWDIFDAYDVLCQIYANK